MTLEDFLKTVYHHSGKKLSDIKATGPRTFTQNVAADAWQASESAAIQRVLELVGDRLYKLDSLKYSDIVESYVKTLDEIKKEFGVK